MRHVILGTAGHIDHGKSSLVKALTGTDPDRLKEEKERGITIDIGFADIDFPDRDIRVGIVDVPGHERLIKNMLAGAGGIDMVMLVVAADEGIMPQTREHLSICNLLKVKSGLIVITKKDLVNDEWLALVEDDIREFVRGTFLEKSPITAVSSISGENLDLLKTDILNLAEHVSQKASDGLFRLPIDRVFTLKGFGTVITGTAVSGKISENDPIEIIPAGIKTKVRGLHSHGKPIKTAIAGQRVAVNLQGVEKTELTRGDTAVTPDYFRATESIDAFLELLPDSPRLKSRELVHFYSGTAETTARVILYDDNELKNGESGYCRIKFKNRIAVTTGDRYIIRRFSPLETMGGGEVLDPWPKRRKRKEGIEDLKTIHEADRTGKILVKIDMAGISGVIDESLRGWLNCSEEELNESIDRLVREKRIKKYDDVVVHHRAFDDFGKKVAGILEDFHKTNPLKQGMDKEEVRNMLNMDSALFNLMTADSSKITADKNLLRISSFNVSFSDEERKLKEKILEILDKNGFQPPTADDLNTSLGIDKRKMSDIIKLMIKEGSIVRINDVYHISKNSYDVIIYRLKTFFSKKNGITVSEFKDILNTSRKYALPILEFLDANKVTLRVGDIRKLISKN